MMPGNLNLVIALFACLVLLVIVLRYTTIFSVRGILRLVLNFAVGVLLIAFFNFIAGYLSFSVPLNLVTAASAGFLGLPGLFLVAAVQLWLL